MRALALERREEETERRTPDECPADRREAPPGRLPRAVGVEELRPCDAAARMLVHEGGEHGNRTRHRDGVRVVDEDELAARLGNAAVQVGGVAERALILERACPVTAGGRAPGDVRDHDDLVDLGRERRQRLGELGAVAVGDNDRRDHASACR